MNTSIRIKSLLAAAFVGAMLLTGCSVQQSSVEKPTSAPAADTADAPAESGTKAVEFGSTITYNDGLAVTVSEPKHYKPSHVAAGVTKGEKAYVFEVSITNGTNEDFDPFTDSTVSSGSEMSSQISDVGNDNIGFGAMSVILPGKTLTWKEAYSIKDVDDIVFQLSPGFEYDDAIFTNSK